MDSHDSTNISSFASRPSSHLFLYIVVLVFLLTLVSFAAAYIRLRVTPVEPITQTYAQIGTASQQPEEEWVWYADLPEPPAGLQIYFPCDDCMPAVRYDGAADPETVAKNVAGDMTYPDLKVMAYLHETRLVYLNPAMDRSTLRFARAGMIAQDKFGTYHFNCKSACGYPFSDGRKLPIQ